MAPRPIKIDLPEGDPPPSPTPAEIEFFPVTTDMIDDPAQPMRSELTPASVEDLVMSIKQVGIIEPLVVKLNNGRYEVIAGHRRLFAAKLAKLPIVPCYVRKANNEQTEMLKIHENLYRAEIKPTDEAKHFSYLIQKQKMTPTQIAKLISKSESYVVDRLAILNYPDFLAEAMASGEISFSVAREFARFDDEKQMRSAVWYAKRGGMTQEMARKWVQDYKRQRDNPQIQEETIVTGQNGQKEVEHSATCVYCGKGVRLIEAEVVYMHHECLNHVLFPETPSEITPAA